MFNIFTTSDTVIWIENLQHLHLKTYPF